MEIVTVFVTMNCFALKWHRWIFKYKGNKMKQINFATVPTQQPVGDESGHGEPPKK